MLTKEEILQDISVKVYEYAYIPTQEIPFSYEVVKACEKNYCGRYAKTWTCPPGIGSFDTVKQNCLLYKNAIVFTTCHGLEDSFDIDGMNEAREKHEKITDKVAELFVGQSIKVMSAKSCSLCAKCTYPTSPCRFPEKIRSTVEANGISVVDLAKKCGIKYNNGPNTVTYFSVILYGNEKNKK